MPLLNQHGEYLKRRLAEFRPTDSGCHEWVRAVRYSRNGWLKQPYGYISLRLPGPSRKVVKLTAHRVAFAIHAGIDPLDNLVLHNCDNSLCINPEHLRLGTHDDNMADMVARERYCPHPGQKNGNAKISDMQAEHIVSLLASHRAQEIVEIVGEPVTLSLVRSIAYGRTWRHLTTRAA
jgi:hypothetical protein